MKNSNEEKKSNYLFIVVILLLIFSLVVIYNATSYYAQANFNNPYRFVYSQLVWILIGLTGFIFFSNISYHKLKNLTYILFLLSIILLILLSFVGVFLCKSPNSVGLSFIPCINGASRWFYFNPPPFPAIPFFGVLGFQPSELTKLAVILYLSFQLDRFKKNYSENEPFTVYIVISVVISFLLLMQPNMSTAALIFGIATVIYFISGFSLKLLWISLPIILVFGSIFMVSSPYRRNRLITLVNRDIQDTQDAGYHIKQVLIGLGSGGFLGKGFGQSRQKFQYLPEVASDSIFAIIGEEFGFVGSIFVILIFGFIIYTGFKIAGNAPDKLGKMLAGGITSWIFLQFFINVSAMSGLIPLTGVPIPLISYGGSSMLFTLVGLGILNNIQKKSL